MAYVKPEARRAYAPNTPESPLMPAPPKTRTVRVARRFNAPPDRVFAAWLDPTQAGRWLFATPTGRMTRVEIDGRVGGKFLIVDRREGQDVEHIGQYLELDRPRRLVFSFTVPKYSKESTRVTIEIVPAGRASDLTLTHEGVLPDYEARTKEGWTAILNALAKTLGERPD